MHRRLKTAILLLLGWPTCATVTAAAQQSTPSVAVTGSVTQPLALTAADLAQMPRATVTTTNGGIERRYEGVWLHEILKKAGVPLGEQLRGRALTTYVLAEAQDGYPGGVFHRRAGPAVADNQILLADQANGRAALRRRWRLPDRRAARKARRPIGADVD